MAGPCPRCTVRVLASPGRRLQAGSYDARRLLAVARGSGAEPPAICSMTGMHFRTAWCAHTRARMNDKVGARRESHFPRACGAARLARPLFYRQVFTPPKNMTEPQPSCGIQVFARLRPAKPRLEEETAAAAASAPSGAGAPSHLATPLRPSSRANTLPPPGTPRTGSRGGGITAGGAPATPGGGKRGLLSPTPSAGAPTGKHAFVGLRVLPAPASAATAPRAAAAGRPSVIVFEEAGAAAASNEAAAAAAARFELDAVYTPEVSQRAVWEEIGSQHVDAVLDGFNSTVFAVSRWGVGRAVLCLVLWVWGCAHTGVHGAARLHAGCSGQQVARLPSNERGLAIIEQFFEFCLVLRTESPLEAALCESGIPRTPLHLPSSPPPPPPLRSTAAPAPARRTPS